MKKFNELISRFSWIIVMLGFLPLYVTIFHPSILGFILAHVVDQLVVPVASYADEKLFLKRFPGSAIFLDELPPAKMKTLSLSERLNLFHEMVAYPGRRSLQLALTSFIKVIPGALVIVFFWQHSCTNLVQALKVAGVLVLVFSYFYGASFLENHILISKKIAEYHREYDWSRVFSQAKIPYSRSEFEFQEKLILGCIWIFTLMLQLILMTVDHPESRTSLIIQVAVVNACGLLLLSRIWYLSRKFLAGSMESIFLALETFDPRQSRQDLPLHSSPVLARFETTFNSMMERLRTYERELSQWTFRKAEESRYQAMGEIAALVVHDLSAPMQVIEFCTEQLKEDAERIHNPKYLCFLTDSSNRAHELIDSIRAYLKDPSSAVEGTRCSEVHSRVMRLIQTRFHSEGIGKIQFLIDERFLSLNIQMKRADLIHVLINILSNSVENLLNNAIPDPRIEISLREISGSHAVIDIRDNGTGLTSERYERLTAFTLTPSDGTQDKPSLGLKLVRRLVEQNDGALRVEPSLVRDRGTRFSLKLRVLPSASDIQPVDQKQNQVIYEKPALVVDP
jgi:signal transduction histidine kinase